MKQIFALAETPLPELLVVFGFFILLLAMVDRIGHWVALREGARSLAWAIALLFIGVGVSLFIAEPPAEMAQERAIVSNQRIYVDSEEQFRSHFVGGSIVRDDGAKIRYVSDGSITGKFGQTPASGNWWWSGERYCRDLSIGDNRHDRECFYLSVRNGIARFIGEDGVETHWTLADSD